MTIVCNIRFKPVRLEVVRTANRHYKVSRDDYEGAVYANCRKGKVQWFCTRSSGLTSGPFPSFRIACLHLVRFKNVNPHIQDLGLQRVRRIDVMGSWFTVVTDPNGILHPCAYEDHTLRRELTSIEQAVLLKALNAADKHMRNK